MNRASNPNQPQLQQTAFLFALPLLVLPLLEAQPVTSVHGYVFARFLGVIAAGGIYLLFAWLSSYLPKMGKFFLLPVSIYLLVLTAFCLHQMLKMWTNWTMPNTPFAVYALVVTLLVCYGAQLGQQAVLRMSVLILALLVFFSLSDTVFLLPYMEISRFPSVRETETVLELAIRSFCCFALPAPAVLLVNPDLPVREKLRKSLKGLSFSAVYLVWAAIRNLLVLGKLLPLSDYPLLRTLKMVEVGIGLSGLDYPGTLVLFGVILTAAMVIFSGVCRSLQSKLPQKRYLYQFLCSGILFALLFCWN